MLLRMDYVLIGPLEFCCRHPATAPVTSSLADLRQFALTRIKFSLSDRRLLVHAQLLSRSESRHDHCFSSSNKFQRAAKLHIAKMLAKARPRAAEDHLQYLELMHTTHATRSAELGKKRGME